MVLQTDKTWKQEQKDHRVPLAIFWRASLTDKPWWMHKRCVPSNRRSLQEATLWHNSVRCVSRFGLQKKLALRECMSMLSESQEWPVFRVVQRHLSLASLIVFCSFMLFSLETFWVFVGNHLALGIGLYSCSGCLGCLGRFIFCLPLANTSLWYHKQVTGPTKRQAVRTWAISKLLRTMKTEKLLYGPRHCLQGLAGWVLSQGCFLFNVILGTSNALLLEGKMNKQLWITVVSFRFTLWAMSASFYFMMQTCPHARLWPEAQAVFETSEMVPKNCCPENCITKTLRE